MKKEVYSLIMLFLTQCAMSFADNTDISTLDNVIYVEPFTLEAGAESSISLKMKNTAAIRSFGFDLYLPEGIVGVPNSAGNPRGSLNYDRVPKDDDGYPIHKMTLSFQEGNVIRFLCDAQEGQTFIGNEGEIATLRVNVAGAMAEGDYPIIIRTMKLSETDIANHYDTDYIESTVTITRPGDGRITFDEESDNSEVLKNVTGVDVRVKRTIKADEWSTICLPFAMTETQVKEAFGEDVQLADFTGYDITKAGEDIIGITVNFNIATAIEANHPYIIKVSTVITEFTVDAVDIVAENEPCVSLGWTTGRGSSAVYHPMDFIGTYVADFDFYNDAKRKALFLNGNKLYYATENTMHMKAFRAYFDFDDILTDVENASNIKLWVNNDEVDSLQSLSGTPIMGENTYNLAGQCVGKNYKGIIIESGKKVMY